MSEKVVLLHASSKRTLLLLSEKIATLDGTKFKGIDFIGIVAPGMVDLSAYYGESAKLVTCADTLYKEVSIAEDPNKAFLEHVKVMLKEQSKVLLETMLLRARPLPPQTLELEVKAIERPLLEVEKEPKPFVPKTHHPNVKGSFKNTYPQCLRRFGKRRISF